MVFLVELTKELLSEVIDYSKIEDNSHILNSFSSDYSLETGVNPQFVIYPTNDDEVIRILRLANKLKIPIIPSSSREKYYGATIPKKGGIILDFKKMNKILKINYKDRYIVIEPGVTYDQLIPELRKHGLRISVPLGYPSSASVVSTYIERVPLLTGPKVLLSEGWQCILNMHIILANGMTLDTGTANWCKDKPNFLPSGPHGGPDLSRLFSGAQGTLGIVTKLVIKAKYLPKYRSVVFVEFNDLEDCLSKIRSILWYDKSREMLIISKKNLALILSEKMTDNEINDVMNKCPEWLLVIGLESEDKEKYKIDIEDFKQFGIEVKENLILNNIQLNKLFLNEIELPRRLVNFRYYKNAQHIPFYINKDKISDLNKGVNRICTENNYEMNNLFGYLMPIEQGHTFYMDYTIHYNKNEIDTKKIIEFFKQLSEFILSNGGVIDRPYNLWSDQIFSKNPALFEFLKQIKKQLDPNGILNPGRMGLE